MGKKLTGRALALAGVLGSLGVALALLLLTRPQVEAPVRSGAGAKPAELVATVRSEPRSFNRLAARDRTSHLVSLLTQARLVRVDLDTQELTPGLAEAWTAAPDGLAYTLALRKDVRFSDGTPFTADDVLFALRAVYDERVGSPIAEALEVEGRPLTMEKLDSHTVVVRFPASHGPGLRMLDALPILPRHRLEAALAAGTFRQAWGLATPPAELAGLGPFVLQAYRPGDRLVFARNPYYWRRGHLGQELPLLDRLTLVIVPDQNMEVLRLESGESDLMSAEVPPDDLTALRRAGEARVVVREVGVGLDADFLWFNLRPAFAAARPDRAWLQQRDLRRAISHAVDRAAFARTVYLGAGVPVYGPVTPGNKTWFDEGLPKPAHDVARARQLLAGIGLRDRDGDGLVEDPAGKPARFALLTQKGNSARERGAQFLQEELRGVGLGVDVVTLEQPALVERLTTGDYEAIYMGAQASDTDPVGNLDFWKSSGAFHVWNPGQARPGTAWEARIDDLMARQMAAQDLGERKRLFAEAQRVFAEELPALHFVAPVVHVAHSVRVANARPALLQPAILWYAEGIGIK
jgi:peptide/nickel transport system substrate-binding protein